MYDYGSCISQVDLSEQRIIREKIESVTSKY